MQKVEEFSIPFVEVCNTKAEDDDVSNIAIKESSLNEEDSKKKQSSVGNSVGVNDEPFEYIEIKEELLPTEEEQADYILSETKLSCSDSAMQDSRKDEIQNRQHNFYEEILPIDLCSAFYGTHEKTGGDTSIIPPRKRLKCSVSEKIHYTLNVLENNSISPIDVFRLFFSDEVLVVIVAGTNAFQKQCCIDSGKVFSPVTKVCIEKFFGILMLMNLNCQPNYSCYWSKNKLYGNELVQNAMSYSRFRNILRFLSFTTCLDYDDECNKLSKLQPLIKVLSRSFKLYTPGEELIFYERKIQVGEPTTSRYEYRLFKLCSVEGYTWNFKIDIGKESPLVNRNSLIGSVPIPPSASRIATVERIILSLMNGLMREARILYVSNFYASFELARKLLAKKTYVCGSLKTHHGDVRQNIGEAILTSLPDDNGRDLKGTKIRQYEQDFENAKKGASVSDHVLMVYSPLSDCRVWYIKAASELLIGCSVANAFILYNKFHTENKMNISKFRESIILSLLNENLSSALINPSTPEFETSESSDEDISSPEDCT